MKIQLCGVCGAAESPDKTALKSCGRCGLIRYCSQECQKVAWKTHKLFCDEFCKRSKQSPTLREDIKRLLKDPAEDNQYVCHVQERNGEIEEVTQKKFRDITQGRIYFPGHKISTVEGLERLFTIKPDRRIHNGFSELDSILDGAKIQRFEKEPPKLFLRVNKNFGGLELVSKLTTIRGEELICPFGGELGAHRKTYESQIRSSTIADPSQFTDLGAFANAGFANAALATIHNYKGVPETGFLFALVDIPPMTEILISYGSDHAINKGPYIISDDSYKKAQDFCKKFSYLNINNYYEDLCKRMQFQSIFDNLYLLTRLVLDGSLSLRETCIFLTSGNPALVMLGKKKGYQTYVEVLEKLSKIQKNAPDKIPDLIDLQKQISIRSYELIISIFCEKDKVEDYLMFGQFVDALHYISNGAHIGSRMDTEDEEKQQSKVDFKALSDQYKKIPEHLKSHALSLLDCLIETMENINKPFAIKRRIALIAFRLSI